jgi:hypothetical protein
MNNRLPRISIVLNDAKGQANGGYYGYGNNNGSGYFEEENSRTPISKLFNWFGGKNGVSKKTKTKV